MPRLISFSVIASLVFFAVPVHAQELMQWETDLANAQKQAAASNRLVLVHFWGSWCPPCMEMEKNVFSRPNLGTAISPWYVPVKIRVEDGLNQDLAKQFGVDGYPCDIVMTAQGQIIAKEKGYKPAEKYVAMLNEIAQRGVAQARSNGLGPVTATPPAAAPAAAPAAPTIGVLPPAAQTSPDAGRYGAVPPPENRYAAYAPPVTAQAAPPATPAPVAAAPVNAAPPAAAPRGATPPADDRYASYYQNRAAATPTAPVAAAPVATAPVAAVPVNAASAPVNPAPVAAAPATTVGDRYATPSVPAQTTAAATSSTGASGIMASGVFANANTINTTAAAKAPVQAPAAAAPAPSSAPAAAPIAAAPAKTAVTSTAAGTGANAAPKSPLEDKLPPGSPPLALEGYCPVTLIEKMVWKQGNPLYGAIHLNRTYLFSSAEQQAKFLANPERFCPIISGNDPVVALEKNEIVAGRRQFGLLYENRMILFSSQESYDKFAKESKRYTTELQQALQSSNAIRR